MVFDRRMAVREVLQRHERSRKTAVRGDVICAALPILLQIF